MKTSAAMTEIRKIRNENSQKYLSQSPEERKRQADKTLNWFLTVIGKPVTIVSTTKKQ